MRPFSFMLKNLAKQFRELTLTSTKLQIKNYRNSYNQISNFEIALVNYQEIVFKSLKIWARISPSLSLCRHRGFSVRDLDQARTELIHSYSLSLTEKGNPYYTCSGIYSIFKDKDNSIIFGCKWHQPDSTLHVEGLVLNREILSPDAKPHFESSSLILAKDWLRKMTPLARWHQFRLAPNRFEEVRAHNLTLSDRDMIRHCISMAH